MLHSLREHGCEPVMFQTLSCVCMPLGMWLKVYLHSLFWGQYCACQDWCPSERAADCWTITYERSGTVVKHDARHI